MLPTILATLERCRYSPSDESLVSSNALPHISQLISLQVLNIYFLNLPDSLLKNPESLLSLNILERIKIYMSVRKSMVA
jgi:hypothetical protein